MFSDRQFHHKILNDKKLKLKYHLLGKIGEGSFGKIYKAINRSSNRRVALKIELNPDDNKRSNLALEISVLKKLQGLTGIPQIYHSGKWEYGIFMEMELLCSSLNDEREKEFSLHEIHMLAVELIQILRRIHEKNIIHQDLKPQNIMRRN